MAYTMGSGSGGRSSEGGLPFWSAFTTTAAKFAVAFVLSYQWFGSARHAYWDLTAKGFSNKAMLHSAYAMWATTLGLSLGLAFYSLPPFPGSKKAK